jgi:hypothetical protein
MDNICALETLTKGVGLRRPFTAPKEYHFSEKWLQEKRMKVLTSI